MGQQQLVDHRATRPRTVLGHADERVVAALREVLEAGRERDAGAASGVHRDDGVVERPELIIALDAATRTLCATVPRMKGTRSVDAAQLLAQMVVPAPMRPGWAEVLAMDHSVVPCERLLSVDARLAGAAARPVIAPQTIAVDQGKVFVSSSFIAACESLGIPVQPAPPGNGPAKGHVERSFSSINTLFV
ncbi:hypothetical protein GCM10019016_104950 [Streptomyces prasinosporus]|uniref:Integrase catalytic domain-containing protein n=1 Tax=Streptomyces prasinosporus TaxID=68256 RepID=A0ABP6U891_9ACTN